MSGSSEGSKEEQHEMLVAGEILYGRRADPFLVLKILDEEIVS
jgi:hypothetical protein